MLHFAASRLGVTVAAFVGAHTPQPDDFTQQFPIAIASYNAGYVIDYKYRCPYIRPGPSVQSVVSTLLR